MLYPLLKLRIGSEILITLFKWMFSSDFWYLNKKRLKQSYSDRRSCDNGQSVFYNIQSWDPFIPSLVWNSRNRREKKNDSFLCLYGELIQLHFYAFSFFSFSYTKSIHFILFDRVYYNCSNFKNSQLLSLYTYANFYVSLVASST